MAKTKSLKKYQTGGVSTFFNNLKAGTDSIKNSVSSKVIKQEDMNMVKGSVPKPIGSDQLSSTPKPYVFNDFKNRPSFQPKIPSIPKQKNGGVVKSKKK